MATAKIFIMRWKIVSIAAGGSRVGGQYDVDLVGRPGRNPVDADGIEQRRRQQQQQQPTHPVVCSAQCHLINIDRHGHTTD